MTQNEVMSWEALWPILLVIYLVGFAIFSWVSAKTELKGLYPDIKSGDGSWKFSDEQIFSVGWKGILAGLTWPVLVPLGVAVYCFLFVSVLLGKIASLGIDPNKQWNRK